MRILAFPGRLNTKAKAPVRDWSTQEIADFYRAHRLLAENGAGIGIDRGLSDEGEPWMVFFDTVSQDVFLHIARIDNTCHLVCEPFNMRLDAADITSLIAHFEHAVRDYLSIRSEGAKNVVIHPAARIIMSISAVFLLFKLENGEAYAKGLADKAGVPGERAVSEKSVGPLARAQSAFQRAFDAAEAPVSAALLAGIILATELALSPLRGASSEAEVEKVVALALTEHESVLARSSEADLEAVVADALDHVTAPMATEAASPHLEVIVPEVSGTPDTVQFTPTETIIQVADLGPAVADFRTVQFAPVAVEPAAELSHDGQIVGERKVDTGSTLVGTLFPVTLVPVVSAPRPTEEGASPKKTLDISLARLDEMSQEFGFVRELRLSDSEIYRLGEYYKSVMGGHKSDYKSGGQVLIEQLGLEKVAEADLGLVTAVMHDGSTQTFVGRAELIDDVLTFFT